jgi:hypothetical protein
MGPGGEPVERAGNAATRFLLPVQPSREKPEKKLEALLADLDYSPGQPALDFTIPGSHGKKIRLNDQEYAKLQDANRRAADFIRRNYLSSPSFTRLDPEDQRSKIERVYQQARAEARQNLLGMGSFRARMRYGQQNQP